MSPSLVIREDLGPVVLLTLNRPEKRNALSRALLSQLRDAFDHTLADSTIRAVVISGAGSAFCAGMDLHEANELDDSADAEPRSIATLREFGDLIHRLHTSPKPVIAAVNGDAIAGGAGLMAACDLVVLAESAFIAYPEVRRGLVPAIVMHDLYRQVGDRRARQLVLTGDRISSETALAWGLVNRVTTAELCVKEAAEIAHSLVQCAPEAMAWSKRLLDETSHRPAELASAAAVSASVRQTGEAREGIRAFVEKRLPAWADEGPRGEQTT